MTKLTREEIMRNTTCGDCLRCNRAPGKWATVDFGWCDAHEDWVRQDDTLWETDCESFEARAGFEPQPDRDWEDFSEWD